MYYKSGRGSTVSSTQKSHDKDNKCRGQSEYSRPNFKKLALIVTVLSLVVWFMFRSSLLRTFSDVELKVNRLVKENEENHVSFPETDMVQDEPAVVEFVRKKHIAKIGSSTNRQDAHHTLSKPHKGLVDYLITKKLIDAKVPGYFVEVGTHNGTGFTSTIFLDEELGWSGLVVEPVAEPFSTMLQFRERNRNKNVYNEVIASPVTVSPLPYITMGQFHFNPVVDLWGGLHFRFYKETSSSAMVLCIPLYTLFLAAGVPKQVELLILDIEGSELEVLKTMPFDSLEIQTIVSETCNVQDGPTAVQDFLEDKGYTTVGKLKVPFPKELTAKVSGIITREDIHSEYTIFKINK